MAREFRERLKRRASASGITIAPALAEKLEIYYQLLAKWNAKINLTAFRLTPEGDDAAIALAGAPEQHDFSARSEECLQRVQRADFDSYGADRDDIDCFMQLRARQEFLEPRGFNRCIAEPELSNGFAQEHGLAGFDFDHP